MNLNKLVLVAVAFAVPALAQVRAGAAPTPPPAPKAVQRPAPTEVLKCGAGTRQIGGATSIMEATGCVRFGRDGSRVFHGEYVAYWPTGARQAQGQYEDGFRTGKWTYFDEKGVKTGETEFKAGQYDGLRVEFWPNGQKKLEETYAHGSRQGAQLTFDQTGKVVSQAQFADDRPISQ